MPLVDRHTPGFDSDPARKEDLHASLLLGSCRDFASILRRIPSVDGMNNTFLIRISAIAATMSLVALTSTAAAGRLPRPLGAGEQPLSAGVHVLDLVSREQGRPGYAHFPKIAVTLPSSWFNYNGWGLNDGGALSVSFWDVAKVYTTGCHWRGKPKIDPGRTAYGLARVLATRPLRHASRPRVVVLSGFHGRYLKWSVPNKINFTRCGQGYFESWTGRGWATDRWQQGPGQVDRLWILDVNGKRLVIDANYLPWATRKQRAQLDHIVHSIKFLSASPRKPASATGQRAARDRNGRWIAYSTSRGDQPGRGSAVFLTRSAGGRTVLVAGGHGGTQNACPVFSPNGRLLAFARVVGGRSTIEVVPIGGRTSPIAGQRRVLKVAAGQARSPACPRWSSNSSRLAYRVPNPGADGRQGKLVVRGLDGSFLSRAIGDPTLPDFDRHNRELVSPTGALIAKLNADGLLVVSRPDGSDRRRMDDLSPAYAIAGWSPDGRKVLLMSDGGGIAFTMQAVSVNPPFTEKTVVAAGRLISDRDWPGNGDVSWQPIPPA
jgi:hypothetical protein